MFTGIIETTLRVVGATDGPRFRRLTLACDWADVKVGESIAVNGCCLTVAELTPGELAFDVIPETLSKTNLAALAAGNHVNVERALRIGDRLDGHFVQGHIDGIARLISINSSDEEWRLTIEAPRHLRKYLTPKGSVTVDGISLTLASLTERTFDVALIPTTLKLTTLGQKAPGWLFNLEMDVLSKTIVSYLEWRDQNVE
jgi:riboflavin synthase